MTSTSPSRMSKTIAVFGVGPGMGRSVARRFGREGFQVALVARNQTRLDAFTGELADRRAIRPGRRAGVRTLRA
jgi:short-subunit dehydrogenase